MHLRVRCRVGGADSGGPGVSRRRAASNDGRLTPRVCRLDRYLRQLLEQDLGAVRVEDAADATTGNLGRGGL